MAQNEDGFDAVLRTKTDDLLYLLLRDGKVREFNQQIKRTGTADLTRCDFRHVDLRGIEAQGLDFGNCYFRQADLRGIDFTGASLEGASIHAAKISGAYFPKELTAEEINMSLLHGTRMRYR
jgi:uncharacterized protein YjbI with pentapeptide repeats